jgi:uncharacterized repeat protein (TIGR02543 family)
VILQENPTRPGYIFTGWEPEVPETMPAESKTLTAQWTPNTNTAYKVEHYQQDVIGEGYILEETENLEGTTDTEAIAQAKSYDGFIENENHMSRVDKGNIEPDGSLILKLYYDRNIYKVDFVDHDDTELKSETIRYMGGATAPADPEREGYTFGGWDKAFDNVTSDLTVTATYTINQYTITFDTGVGGSAVELITQDYGTEIEAPSNPTREGYTFMGWNPEVPGTMPAEDITITAQWEAVDYSITYHLDGGENHGDNPETYTIEDAITLGVCSKTYLKSRLITLIFQNYES